MSTKESATRSWYAYKIWNNTRFQIIVVTNDLVLLRTELTYDLVNYANTIEEVMCGTVFADDIDEAIEHAEGGEFNDNSLPKAVGDPMKKGRIYKRVASQE